MKKLLCLMVVLLLVMAVFVACGDDDTTAETTTTTTPITTTDDPTTTTSGDPTTTTTGEKPTAKDPVMAEDAVDLAPTLYGGINVEDHHGALNNNPALVFCVDSETIYPLLVGTPEEIDGEKFIAGSQYQLMISINGTLKTIERVNLYDGGTWGYLRCEIGTAEDFEMTDGAIDFTFKVYFVDKDTNKIQYYLDVETVAGVITWRTAMAEAEKPEGLTAVEGVTCISGPDLDGDEGAKKAFDGDIKTKLCTSDEGAEHAIIASLGGKKYLKGISLVNANDNEGTGRTVINFEVWVSADGENWGDAPAWSTDGAGVNKEDVSANFTEIFYDLYAAPFANLGIYANYVKIVINNGELYQFSEVIFYEAEAPAEVTVPEMAENAVSLVPYLFTGYAVEDHHDSIDRNLALVFGFEEETIYPAIVGTVVDDFATESNYQCIISINGTPIVINRLNLYHGGTWGYLRCDIGPASDYIFNGGVCEFLFKVYFVNTTTNKVEYYLDVEEENGPVIFRNAMKPAENKPEGLTAVEGVTCTAGPDLDGDEGAKKAFDGDIKTKLCTTDEGAEHAIVASLGATKTLKGISLVNANDNEGSGRTVINFEVWVSTDGTNWGTAAAWSTTGEGINKDDVSTNFEEQFYSFGETTVTGAYVKLVINNGERYQFSEVIFYE